MKPFYTIGTEEVLKELKSSITGLTNKEAEARLAKYGKNALQEGKKRSLIAKFFDQLKDVMIIVLLVAAAVSAAMCVINNALQDWVNPEWSDLIDSGIILLIVLVNAVIGLIQENKAEASLSALKNLNKPYTKVIRDGSVQKIKSEDVVVGDVIVLEAGDIIPADMRLFECASLKVEEAALTGESVPSEKHTEIIENAEAPLGDRSNMCYSTGVVTYGRGQGVVTATGMNTEVGKIAKMLQEDDKVETPLQIQLAKTAKVLSVIVLAIAVVIFGVILIRGFFFNGGQEVNAFKLVSDAFLVAVAIAVAAIPEGLPAVVTIVLSIGVQRMSERKAIVKNLPAVEALGCCEIICSDKTGTLTLNQMTVKELYTYDVGNYAVGAETPSTSVNLLVRGMVLCNDTKRVDNSLIGDPTETALVAYADGLNQADIMEKYKRVGENPFDSVRKLMSTINEVDGKLVGHIKGAPDLLVGRCKFIADGDKVRPITDEDKRKIALANERMADKALRVLGVAVKFNDVRVESVEDDMVFVGLVGMIDPPRAEVKGAVETCRRAGMRAIMITGDHAATAAAIAREIGILSEGQLVMTGAELDKLSDEEFQKILFDISVYARVSPENKVRIVKAFKAKGKKVAMTGDGVNDAPSIKSADIGVGMGITGTDVSKGASDMVLADDNFATIVNAVEEGRKVYANIKKSIQYLLSANIAEVLCLFIVTIIGLQGDFLTAVMILWVNLVTDSLPALALGMEKAEPDIMNDKPRKSESSLFAGKTGIDILIQGTMQTILVLASFFIGEKICTNIAEARTMAFISLCLIQLFHAYNVRSQKHSLFASNPLGNGFMNISFLVCTALIVLVVEIPPIAEVFNAESSLLWYEWLISIGLAFMVIPCVEIQKLIERAIAKRKRKVMA